MIFALLAGLFVVALFRTAWVCDDAYITFRTIDNFVHGFGLRWNIDERVQSFTHPLWMFLVAGFYWFTREPYYTALGLSFALSLITFWLAGMRAAASLPLMGIGLAALLLSRAFVQFSTSGLENPLTHLLLALFLLTYWRPAHKARPTLAILFAALLLVNRPDAILLIAPALCVLAVGLRMRRALLNALLALLPFLAWELFSLIYYGFLFPNTAYAKLDTGISATALAHHGILYLIDSAASDPVTLLVIGLAIVAELCEPDREWAIPTGLILYVLYLIRIGGDFMSGRFLTAPLLCAVLLLVHRRRPALRAAWPAVLALLLIAGFSTPHAVLSASYVPHLDRPSQAVKPSGIADEWAFYWPSTGLLNLGDGQLPDVYGWRAKGLAAAAGSKRVVVFSTNGFYGYYAGPSLHIVDTFGLSDPLLARLPAHAPWRIGHFERTIPAGYLETLRTGDNVIVDKRIGAYYHELQLITRDPIWSHHRLLTILRMNLGQYSYMLDGIDASYH